MIILLHVIIAIVSMVQTTYTYFRPSGAQLTGSYILIGLVLASGFYLVAGSPAHIVQACTMGLIYLAIVSFGIAGATRKLAAARTLRKRP